jgi:pyrroline-5-carboxylate reductase
MRIGIIGFGNMGSAFGEGLKKSAEVVAFDTDASKKEKALEMGIGWAKDLEFLVANSDLLLLAVKPKDAGKVLENLRGRWRERSWLALWQGYL